MSVNADAQGRPANCHATIADPRQRSSRVPQARRRGGLDSGEREVRRVSGRRHRLETLLELPPERAHRLDALGRRELSR